MLLLVIISATFFYFCSFFSSIVFDTLIQKRVNTFRGDLTDISAEKEALIASRGNDLLHR